MAEATKFENIVALADTNTLSGTGCFGLLLTAGSAAATLTLTIGSNTIVLKAVANASQELQNMIKLGYGQTATIALTGTGATAYAIYEVE